MKKTCLICLYGLLTICYTSAQQYVIDPWHLNAVAQNAAVRSSAESTHEQYLGKINNNINDLNTNVGAVVLAQTMIYEGLSNVNSALKNGLAVKNMAVTVADMTYYINQALTLAGSEPYLLTFANNVAAEMRRRALALVSDVSSYVLKDGNNVLADYNTRDELLRKVTHQLQILDGLAYGAWKAMYWAKERGIIASINPYAGFINQDKTFVTQIIQNAKYLKP
ncbi:hypothetical protein DIU31_028405 [Mucilaginibacter rubeus]|uniref:DUF4141 domain-containing protein n=1 Tax=Mucilaginibacter rubeus TaxID=2027860 RepID=A0AAE6JM28_9SPHI|nr:MULTISPECIES: hypothetical protein [Mucilaginibacter]QEM07230.1 hypothetical protein DIU31_028405 [Mucilaginibacter rubeus]QEM19685.1 hypothetical protein DIU38_027975 [Mucilaginibacter gossypii]QTE43617.1 hypothetical protein J3L19_32645 [Mucilaginibacter rubeus]QTE50217.1 hypothetical protein J3L21_32600 [Mucilaginibacter rubeus]QTE55305.1 hypothetical protein J3L23_24220 [Mucilaginibacter rubeus]